ncbi:MAG: hypothetical protein KME19_10860 [Microcoleus vaginatus WJT46-NPBG5]|nr:hypothetical protein [Microcoleus vaginatus WJT46-NPBG5]
MAGHIEFSTACITLAPTGNNDKAGGSPSGGGGGEAPQGGGGGRNKNLFDIKNP